MKPLFFLLSFYLHSPLFIYSLYISWPDISWPEIDYHNVSGILPLCWYIWVVQSLSWGGVNLIDIRSTSLSLCVCVCVCLCVHVGSCIHVEEVEAINNYCSDWRVRLDKDGGTLISRIHPGPQVPTTVSNVLPISATYTDVFLQGEKHIQLEPLTMATISYDCPLHCISRFALVEEHVESLGDNLPGKIWKGVSPYECDGVFSLTVREQVICHLSTINICVLFGWLKHEGIHNNYKPLLTL